MVTTIRSKPGPATADECFTAMQRHNRRGAMPTAVRTLTSHAAPLAPVFAERGGAPPGDTPREIASAEEGDILYGAKAIARYIFGDDNNRSRRRVFNLWAHYQHRKERAGFIKLKGALCLSKSQWKAFHGLG
ncbi:hypothetical protein [Bradyrhizobium sp.]